MTDDFYDLLEVPSDASQDEIKKAFRKQVRIYHPDLNDDDRAQAQFTALKKAYDILGDPVERKAYDRLGHETYVAKRTSGIPSPDSWGSTSGGASGDSEGEPARTKSTKSTASASGGSSAAGSDSAGRDGSRQRARSARTNGGTATAGRSRTSEAGARVESRIDAATGSFLRWWRNRKLAWPLIWLAAFLYVAGLGHFGLANRSSIRELVAELTAVGAEPALLWETLTTGRRGVESVPAFLAGAEPITPPLPRAQWYAVLLGLVALALVVIVGARIGWRRDPWGPITLDETIVLAIALATASLLASGPLLAGMVLMPLLFGVIVHRTRALPGWSPSSLFVLAVCTPLLTLAAGVAGYATLAGDLLGYVLIPLVGAFGLPLRATIRKRFGR